MKKPHFNFFIIMNIIIIFAFSAVAPTVAYGDKYNIESYYYADFLNTVGLFKGDSDGYKLGKSPNRSETLVMLIRLIGKENQALSNSYNHHFADSNWADKYIDFAYGEKIANGISDTQFGGEQIATEKQYYTFILRALGYYDFEYENACTVGRKILNIEEKTEEESEENFTRGDMAYISYKALYTKIKDKGITLKDALISDNIISLDAVKSAEDRMKLHTEKKASTTIMVYMIASDLESMQGRATKDLAEITSATANENVNLYVMTGGTKYWKNSIMADGKTQFFKLDNKKLTLVEDLGTAKMTEPNTLTNFVTKSATMSPADRYILVFWDHGMGTKGGFGKDEVNGGEAMSVADIKVGLENAKVQFDIVGFDACLMATVEIAAALENVCSFMIASEEMAPACGWYYTTWLDTLAFNPNVDTLVLASLIVDSAIVHGSVETNANSVLSIVDTNNASHIYERLKNILDQQNLQTGKIEIENNVKMLGGEEGGYDQFDVANFFNNVTGNIDVKGKNDLIGEVKKSVVYNRLSAPFMEACGLAFYYP